MRKIILALLFGFCFALIFVVAQQAPPSLDDSHLFYGAVQGLPSEGYTIRARNGVREFSASIVNGQYGYSPILRVQGMSRNTITFVVISSSGLDTKEVGTAAYQPGGVTKLDFQYVGTASAQQAGQAPPEQPPSTQLLPPAQNRTALGTPLPPCAQQWQCGAWTACVNSAQTRVCQRNDLCGAGSEVVVTAKPPEIQACQASVPYTPPVQQPFVQQQLCVPGIKQCQGNILQQCSPDGMVWNTLQTCPAGCDMVALTCKIAEQPAVQQPKAEEKESSVITISAGIVILLLIIVLAAIYIVREQKRYAPLKQYIIAARTKGYNDQQIKTSLVASGWDLQKVERYLK